jgi:hypothetical protein
VDQRDQATSGVTVGRPPGSVHLDPQSIAGSVGKVDHDLSTAAEPVQFESTRADPAADRLQVPGLPAHWRFEVGVDKGPDHGASVARSTRWAHASAGLPTHLYATCYG